MTTMGLHLAANPEWQDRCRDESARIGDGSLDIGREQRTSLSEACAWHPLPMNFRDGCDHGSARYFIPAGPTW